MSQLTVGQLIELLKQCSNLELPVYSDGCDCVGPARGIEVYSDSVTISRSVEGLETDEDRLLKFEESKRMWEEHYRGN